MDLDVASSDARSGSSRRWLAWAAVIAVLLAIFLGSAFTPALQDDVDSAHAEAARELVQGVAFGTAQEGGVDDHRPAGGQRGSGLPPPGGQRVGHLVAGDGLDFWDRRPGFAGSPARST